jgi:hypothetical protein
MQLTARRQIEEQTEIQEEEQSEDMADHDSQDMAEIEEQTTSQVLKEHLKEHLKGQQRNGQVQSAKERQLLRQQYRLLIESTSEKKDEYISPYSEGLKSALSIGDDLFGTVTTPREAALDTEFLTVASQLGAEQSTRLESGVSRYTIEGYVNKLLGMWENQENEKIEEFHHQHVQSMFVTTPSRNFLYGPLHKEVKKRTIKPRPQKEKVGKKVVPETVKSTKKDEQTETTRRVEHVNNCINKIGQPIGFWNLVLDPGSFSRTVENIFHVAFLIKDGRVRIKKSEQNFTIEPSDPPLTSDFGDGSAKQIQRILKIDVNTWQKLVEEHGVTEAFIPPYRSKK